MVGRLAGKLVMIITIKNGRKKRKKAKKVKTSSKKAPLR